MREIEIKLRLKDKPKLLENAKKAGIFFGQPVTQHDIVYGRKIKGHFNASDNWLRIRVVNNGKSFLTLKRDFSGHLDSIERELEIGSPSVMQTILEDLGFSLYLELTKTRRTAHMLDMELCLDEVEGLGSFLEIEKMCDDNSDYKTVSNELWGVLKSLGQEEEDRVDHGYDVLIRRAKGLKD